jgi:hypothetical protein
MDASTLFERQKNHRAGKEKSHPADRMASVLVGCQGFEPWTY